MYYLSNSSTPTAVGDADPPKGHVSPFGLRFLVLQVPRFLAHTSDTTNTSRVCTSAARYNAAKLSPLWPPFRRDISLNFGFNYFLAEGSST
jgi:hypothetical protein